MDQLDVNEPFEGGRINAIECDILIVKRRH